MDDDITIMNEVNKEDKERERERERSESRKNDRRSNERGRGDRRNSDRGRGGNRKRGYGGDWDKNKMQLAQMQQSMMQSWGAQNQNENMGGNPPLPPPLPGKPPAMPPAPGMQGMNNPMNSNMQGMNNSMGGPGMGQGMPGMGPGMSRMGQNMPGMGQNIPGMPNQMGQGMNNMQGMPNQMGPNMPGMNPGMQGMGQGMMGQGMPNMNTSMGSNMSGMPSGVSVMNNMMGNMQEMIKMTMGNMNNMNNGMGMGGGMNTNSPNIANKAAEQLPGTDELSDKMIGPVKPGEDRDAPAPGSGMMGMIPTMDPNLAAAWGGWVMAPDGQMVRQPIVYRRSVLYPPTASAPTPTLRERPPGCRTIFIGGVPEMATEEVIRDIFEHCGPIQTVRMNKKNFAHIRYMAEMAVSHAVLLSGWRLKVDNKDDQPYTGRLHVDYAQARDDLQEYEAKQRQVERDERMRFRMIDEMRPPSPPGVPHYSDGEAHSVVEKLKSDANFGEGVEILETWLNRGDCSKRNAGMFYTMIQAANTHVKRLLQEQNDFEIEMQRLKEQWKGKIQISVSQFGQIESVFGNASHQKVWDHFTKPQRKNIQSWKHQLTEAKALARKNKAPTDEMDVSEEEEEEEKVEEVSPKKKKKKQQGMSTYDSDKLKEDSENWACQVNAYRTEVEAVKAEMTGELDEKKTQIKILQQTLQGMQKQLIEMQKKKSEDEAGPPKPKVLIPLAEAESRIVAVVSTYLNTHPYGVTVDYIWTHLLKIDSSILKEDVTAILEKYKDCFASEENSSDKEKTWKFVAFDIKY